MATDLTPEQKRYLEGFASGISAARVAATGAGAPRAPATVTNPSGGPEADHVRAQDRFLAAGKKLSEQERFKRDEHPFDAYHRLKAQAAANEAPKPADNFRWRYYGLFYTAPNQAAYMCRLRMPNGILTHWQFAGVADVAERFAGGYAHVTTRANLQIREIEPRHGPAVVEAVADLGLTSRGSGVDNVRNVTGTPTAGLDPQELIDTRPYAREMHFHLLNDRSLSGLPRKFNIAFDGAGTIATLEDTNDIGFQAVDVPDGFGVEPGIWFRLTLGGITGHEDFARDTGVIVAPADATRVADAVLRVFIDRGDRTDRNKARLKYVLDAMGFDAFLAEVETKLGSPLTRVPSPAIKARPVPDRLAHVGVHAQRQPGLNWIGVALPVGRLTPDQMRGLALMTADLGDGDIRLTVWQNLLLSGVADVDVPLVVAAVERLGLTTSPTNIAAGVVACTGNVGCRFAATDTKRHAAEIIAACDGRPEHARIVADSPVNIHLTGCPNSCAQHFIGDIGLLGTKTEAACPDPGGDDDLVEAYQLVVGGGAGPDMGIAREIARAVPASDVPALVARMLEVYEAKRSGPEETFLAFARRHDVEALQRLFLASKAETRT